MFVVNTINTATINTAAADAIANHNHNHQDYHHSHRHHSIHKNYYDYEHTCTRSTHVNASTRQYMRNRSATLHSAHDALRRRSHGNTV